MKSKDEQKGEAIIQHTLRLIFTEGLAGLKMSSIAQSAGIAVGTLYLYFKNKEELLNHIFLQYKRESMFALAQKIDCEQPFKVNFKQLWLNFLRFAVENPEQATLLEQLHRSPYLRPEVLAETEILLDPIRQMLNEGKQQMLIKHIDNEILLAFLSGSINQIARRFVEKDRKLTPEQFEQAFTMAWDAVRA